MELKGKKIFIIGGGGKLGLMLKDVFSKYNAVSFSRDEFDITNPKHIEKNIIEAKPDIVIDAAAFNAVDKCEDEKFFAEAMAVNGSGPGNLADACKKCGATFIFYSSDYVFDGNNPEGYDEKSPVKPVNAYGRTKLFGESAIIKSKCNYYIIRTSRLFGPPGISEHGRSGVIGQVKKLDNSSLPFEVVDGEQACATYSFDLAEATEKLIINDYPFGTYHIVNSDPCSRLEFYKKIAEILHVNVKIIPVDAERIKRPAARPLYSVLKNTKFTPLRTWEEALQEMVKKFY